MRLVPTVVAGALVIFGAAAVYADQKRSDQVINSVVSGLLGTPQQPAPSPDAIYSAQERDRLVSLLQGGEYVTTRQGEPVDMVAYGVPLTRVEHVYTAKPVAPSQTNYRRTTP